MEKEGHPRVCMDWTLCKRDRLGIIGFFLIKAAITKDAQHIVNTDKAFDFLGDDVSHFSFIAVAIATICYGIFMFAFGSFYDTDKD
jgi:hypothetical protein